MRRVLVDEFLPEFAIEEPREPARLRDLPAADGRWGGDEGIQRRDAGAEQTDAVVFV